VEVFVVEPRRFWFPSKSYGWGWGFPDTWQGRAVLVVFAVVLIVGAIVIDPRYRPGRFIAYTIVLNIGLVIVCWAKGEPPRWRSGGSGK
jgi:formate hydrogenlyase subunit 3/multisubunit Na+/H+ antiporter MnhD subunit